MRGRGKTLFRSVTDLFASGSGESSRGARTRRGSRGTSTVSAAGKVIFDLYYWYHYFISNLIVVLIHLFFLIPGEESGPSRGRTHRSTRRSTRREEEREEDVVEEEGLQEQEDVVEEEGLEDQEGQAEDQEGQDEDQEGEEGAEDQVGAEVAPVCKVYLRGPSKLPDRPIPELGRPIIRPDGPR
jgi:hypothetical protein